MIRNIKSHHVISATALVGVTFLAFNLGGSGQPLFQNTDNFVLFAQEKIKLEQKIQVSNGDIGSNKEIDIQKDAIINGNLFADNITIDKNTVVNGNASFNKLKLHEESQILGTQTKPVQLPIANLSSIPDFPIGTQDFKFEGQTNSLSSGSYRDIVVEKNSRLVLTGGVYNLRKLELKENSTLIFDAPTTINIQFKLRGRSRVLILPGQNTAPAGLTINYLGIKPKHEKDVKENADDEINSHFDDDKERKDHKDRKIGRPIVFDKNSILNFKLLAPKAKVHLEKKSTLRGQILARKISVEKDSLLSREETFVKISDLRNVVTDEEDGSRFFVNEIIINFTSTAAREDAEAIARLVNGRITGFVTSANIYQIEVTTADIAGLERLINQIEALNNPKIEGVMKNYILHTL